MFHVLTVRLVGILRAGTMLLKGNVRKVAIFRCMSNVKFNNFLTLFFRMGGISHLRYMFFVRIIMFRRLLPTSIGLLTRRLRNISITHRSVDCVINGMRLVQVNRPEFLFRFLLPATSVTLTRTATIMLVRFVILGGNCRTINVQQINDVTNLLRTTHPALVIHGLRFRGGDVAYSPFRRVKVIFVEIFQVTVDTRAFVTNVIVVPRHPSTPITSALSTRIVITLTHRLAMSNATLRRPLNRHSTNECLVALRLLRNGKDVLFSVLVMTNVPTLYLRYYCKGGGGYCSDDRSRGPFRTWGIRFYAGIHGEVRVAGLFSVFMALVAVWPFTL